MYRDKLKPSPNKSPTEAKNWIKLQKTLIERNFFNQIHKLKLEGRIDVDSGHGWDRKIRVSNYA